MDKFIELEQRRINCRLCVSDIYKLAEEIEEIEEKQLNQLYSHFLDTKDENALSCLAFAMSVNKQLIDREVFIRSVQWMTHILHSVPMFNSIGPDVIQDLIHTIASDDYPKMVQFYFADVALDLCVKHELENDELIQRVNVFKNQLERPTHLKLIDRSLKRYKNSKIKGPGKVLTQVIQSTVESLLPDEAPKSITGGDYTVRRVVEKIGRNDHCHCGSGKKYKKCCFETDQEKQRDASHHAGVTKSELKANPSIVNDGLIIRKMNITELLALDVKTLDAKQLYTAYDQLFDNDLFDRCYEVISRLIATEEEYIDKYDASEVDEEIIGMGFDGARLDIYNCLLLQRLFGMAVKNDNTKLVRHIVENSDMSNWLCPKEEHFIADIVLNPKKYQLLTDAFRSSVDGIDEEHPYSNFAGDFSFNVATAISKANPVLSILFSRASIVSKIQDDLHPSNVLRLVQKARTQLSLDPWGDCAETACDLLSDKFKDKEAHEIHNAQLEYLTEELSISQNELAQAKKELLGANQQLASNSKKKSELKKRPKMPSQPRVHDNSKQNDGLIKSLQSKITDLKAILNDQTAERQEMRKELTLANKKAQSLKKTVDQLMIAEEQADEITEIDAGVDNVQLEPKGRIVLPEYSSQFKKSCNDFPKAIVAKSISMIGRLASHDEAVWQSLKPLRKIPDYYRIKLSQDYRLMIKWLPGDKMEVLEIIPRQELEHWIKKTM